MPGVYTTGSYDTNEWEPVDMVTVSHNESISALRDIGVGIGQIFGGKSDLLEKKILDLREGLIKEAEKLLKTKGDNYMIVGFDMETSQFDRAIIVIGTGTLLRKKKQSAGATRSLKTRRRR
uniref:Heavy metal-binding domain-containing protein n=1 Tax=viral metagenome TaxID=1070528 RepID=A0A6C0ANW9_9ZZZZ